MDIKNLPKEIKIFDVIYSIEYVDNPSDVDIHKRDSLWGQIDFWTQSIRIYNNNTSINTLWQALWHEILHGICNKLKIDDIDDDTIDMLATGINSVLIDNNLKK